MPAIPRFDWKLAVFETFRLLDIVKLDWKNAALDTVSIPAIPTLD
jgi:hypothetical protein